MTEFTSETLLNWSKEDRFKLLTALKTYHSSDIENISQEFANKTQDEVKQAIDWYKEKALHSLKYSADKVFRRLRRPRKNQEIPLTQWSNLLLKTYNLDQLHTATATSLRLLTEFEESPHPDSTANVDFKKIRLMIANALEGRPLPAANEITQYVLNKCLIESAIKSKGFIPEPELENFLTRPNNLRSKADTEHNQAVHLLLANVHYLAMQQSYNPLNIPHNFLTPPECNDATTLKFK